MNDAPDTDPKPQSAPSSGRWMRVLLFASLAVNLAVAGLVAGAVLRQGGGPERDRAPQDASFGRDLGLGPYGRALSKNDKDHLRSVAKEKSAMFRENRKAIRAAVEETVATLREPEFDRARVEAAFANQRRLVGEAQREGHGLLIERLSALSHADRMTFADRLEQAALRGPKRR
ncbi:periplasmic heavy metal sensor [Alphaproteobacteria bacterium KMM 3653]|uniref:Periplasmic heavy metal sensor n=1 Tax=Harenicola maris TaxID=2841044 RepID=A0AAP2G8Y3_9RHOB|nr:periplasmic heavy metal sensor [Harenicola maris]